MVSNRAEILAKKMERAKFYLSHPVWTIDRVAQEVGYGRYRFNQLFKEYSGASPGEFRKSATGGIVSHAFVKAQRYLRQTDLSLEEVAFRTGYSNSKSLCCSFKRFTGESPAIYRARFRGKPAPKVVSEAKTLLVETDKSLRAIAFDLGYADPSGFTKTFEKHVGEACRAYRRRHWGGRFFPSSVEKVKTLLVETDLSQEAIGARVGFESGRNISLMIKEAEGMTPNAYRKRERARLAAERLAAFTLENQ